MLRHRISSVRIRSDEDTFIARICWGIGYFRCGYVLRGYVRSGYVQDGYVVRRPKAAGWEKSALSVPTHSKSHPTLFKPSILQTWVFYPVGFLCLGHQLKNFHLPGMPGNVCRKGLKFQEIYIFKKRPKNGLKAGIF